MLFSVSNRFDNRPIRASETDFEFLDRCAWPAAARVRVLMEACLQHYPPDEQAELMARIRSGDRRHFASATFELFIHEYLYQLGFELIPHPEMPNGSQKRPDFRVCCPDGHQLYLEAVCASDNDGRDESAERRKGVALESLDSNYHPDFIVAVDSTGNPTTQPSGSHLTADVIRWLNTLNADLVLKESADNYEALPEFNWQYEDWRVRVRAIPVKPEARGQQRRLIGSRGFGAHWIDGWTPIRDAILAKARRYGELDLPLVVAVNVNTFKLDPIDEAQALFGQEQFIFTSGVEQDEPEFKRAPNGAWLGRSGPRGRRCSGAWLFSNLSPYTLARIYNTLFVNPWANHDLPDSFLQMPHAKVVDDKIQRNDGLTFRKVFDLSETWPE
jgi:hypothetical protein